MNIIENEIKRIIKTQKWEIIVHTMEVWYNSNA